MRSLFGLLIGLGVIGGLFAPTHMSAAVAASPSATPTPTPTPRLIPRYFPIPSPLPTNRISIDGGTTWMAIDVFYPPFAVPNVANIQATVDEKVIIKAALAKTPNPSSMLVYYSGSQWTLLNPKVAPINYDPYYMIPVSVTSIIAPLPAAASAVVPRFINGPSPTPSPTPPSVLIFHGLQTPTPSPPPYNPAPVRIRPGDRLSFDDGANWIPVDRVVFPVVRRTSGPIEPTPAKPDQLWILTGSLGASPSTVRPTLLVYADGRNWSYSHVFLDRVAFSPDRKDTIYDIKAAPSPSPSSSSSCSNNGNNSGAGAAPGGCGSGGVTGHGSTGSSPAAPTPTPTPTPLPIQ